MRKLIYAINMSVDGRCDHTKLAPPDDEDDGILDYYTRLVRDVDVFLYGRITYQLMVPYWPDIARNPAGQTKGDVDFARAFDSVSRIVVFSRSLARAEDERTTIVRANLKEEVLKLKQERGRDIWVGGVSIPAQLMELGLIDEYRIVIQPAVVGEGRQLFDGGKPPERLQLKLVESRTFKSGWIMLRYLKQ
jgi:dihydrofolate reductase